ncbi:MAG: hypothetical protein NT049_01145 [Planctomycetota bacterium]|nr:hypothetical protein [Planctomycetota bacterium]
MDEAALREKVGQLLSEVHSLPGVGAKAGVEPGRPPAAITSPMRREMAALEDSLDHVRLAIKYLVFDLEATKRENRLLREMLGDA